MGVLFQVDEMYDIIEVIKLSGSCSDDSLEPRRRLNRVLKKKKKLLQKKKNVYFASFSLCTRDLQMLICTVARASHKRTPMRTAATAHSLVLNGLVRDSADCWFLC